MEKTVTDLLPDTFAMPPYAVIVTLISLLNSSGLADSVVKHCITGLKIITIMHLCKNHDIEIDILEKKYFDAFFEKLPQTYYKNRELITEIMIIENIDQCVKANKILSVDS
ncbi:hypothetical protein Q4Q34_08110 [Flavivirga abyssicola]|uniref:hypothetical protein n=1 Tax=Flavivirga abyssicola TaxID=3063533 RepID=UPI0026DF56EE|nr:hypothetical protein [Flavivirga sp. MEBiC07777]WVK14990.1 hypothetical protein Q4Q34_08110 [Flavivirga sp. MEBiC07777]